MCAVTVTAAHGCAIAIGDGATAEVFTTIDGVHNGPNGPGWEAQIVEGRHHGSTSTVKIASYVNVTPITFSIYYDSVDTQHLALRAAAAAMTRKNFEMTLTDTGVEKYAFAAYVTCTFKGDVENFNIMDVSLAIQGAVTVT
jgi:hypothetical protein